jgi:uroporphyrinogen-III decarboxylase
MPVDDGAARYAEKMKRVMDAVELRRPDRVPTALHATFWLARYGGVSCRELMYDYDKICEITRRALRDLDPDMFYPPHRVSLGPSIEALGYKQLQWPGHGVDDNHPYQYLDREYMTADEYDDFIFDPTGFYLTKYLPRVFEAFEGFEELPKLPGLAYSALVAGIRPFASPRLGQAFAAVQKGAEEVERLARHSAAFMAEMAAMGYPATLGSGAMAPFDYFGDYFRGAKGILTDMRRHPDKLLEAIEKAGTLILRQTVAIGSASPNKFVFIPIHWGPDAFMSHQQFMTFWWPSLRKLLLGLIDNGLIPVVLWEADCTKRLEVIGDIPRGKAVYWFERTDLARAKEVLGDVVCLRGNVSPSLLTTGTPAEVDAACRRLIETVGRDGGLILDCAFGIPDETPVENARAMYHSVRKYGA